MSHPPDVRGPSTDQVLESVADEVRREALVVLEGRTGPVSVRELATAVAALRTGTPYGAVGNAERKPIAVALVHVHLPKLAAADLLEWSPGEDVVPTVDRATLADRGVRDLLAVQADDWDAVLQALADRRRRLALAVLLKADGSLDRETLARRVVARERDRPTARVSDAAVSEARTEFRHAHLPALQDAGLVTREDGAVAYDGHPDLDPDWLRRVTGGDGRQHTVPAAAPGAPDGDRPGSRARPAPRDLLQD